MAEGNGSPAGQLERIGRVVEKVGAGTAMALLSMAIVYLMVARAAPALEDFRKSIQAQTHASHIQARAFHDLSSIVAYEAEANKDLGAIIRNQRDLTAENYDLAAESYSLLQRLTGERLRQPPPKRLSLEYPPK